MEVTSCNFFCLPSCGISALAEVVGAVLNVFVKKKGIICAVLLIINATLMLNFQLDSQLLKI